MKEISPEETMSEDQAREYFIDIILGLEYREFSNSSHKLTAACTNHNMETF